MEINKNILKFIVNTSPVLPTVLFIRKDFLYICNQSIIYRMSIKSMDALFDSNPTDWNKFDKFYYINKLVLDNFTDKTVSLDILLDKSEKLSYNKYTGATEKCIELYNTKFDNIREANIITVMEKLNHTVCELFGFYVNHTVLTNIVKICKLGDNFPYSYCEKYMVFKIGNYIFPATTIAKQSENYRKSKVPETMDEMLNDEENFSDE